MRFSLITPDDWRRFAEAMRDIDRSKPWQATVEPFKKSRSIPQNALFHAWMKIVGDHCGYSPAEMKTICKEQFLTPKVVQFRGVNRLLYPSTSTLTASEFDELMTRIQAWAGTELNITLPSTL